MLSNISSLEPERIKDMASIVQRALGIGRVALGCRTPAMIIDVMPHE